MIAILMLFASGAVFPAQLQPSDERFHLSIHRGSLSSVLEQFTRQTGLQVITQLNVAEGGTRELGPFIGHATANEALTVLFKDSDLSFTLQDESIRVFVAVTQPPRSEDNVQEVLVTGTRIPGEVDGPAPIRVYGDRRIDRYGVSSVSDFSRYLTQQPFAFGAGHLQSGAQFFQMRGLGFDTTLVLINNRRVPPSANSISLNAADINSIPLPAVDRVEVMSDSASAIYGADAIGGVVNIILKQKLDEPAVYLHYGQADGGGMQRRAAASIGSYNDHLTATLMLDYYEQDALMGEERDLWRNQDYRRFGGRDYRVSATNPGNVYSLTAQPLPGLSSSRAAVPVGSPGGKLSPADFLATDGVTNLDSSLSAWSITPLSRRASGYGSVEYSFTKEFNLFGEILAANGEATALRPAPSLNRQIVPASNPFNPFGVPVAVDYLFAGMDPVSHLYETDLLRLVGGARGAFDEWRWEITGLRHDEDGSSTSRGAIDPLRVAAAVNSADPETALNFFSDGPAGSPELLDSLIGPAQRSDFSFSSSLWSAHVTGPMFSVGDQKAELVVGGEWRRDAAGFVEAKRVDAHRDIASAFAEAKVPLWDGLSLKIAVRGDDHANGERTVNPQYGLTWRPAKDWLLRAAYGTSFRPPSLFELYMPVLQPTLPVVDPLRGGSVSNVALTAGGNPDLEVVTARSFTAGFVFSPSELPGLRFGSSYWRVVMDNRIIVPNYQEMLKPEHPLNSRVVRDAPSSQDLEAGWVGRLRSIDITRVNFGALETSGIDLDGSLLMERPWGCLKLDLAVTWVDEYLSRDMSQALPVDRVGIANVQGTIPEWRAVGTIAWKSGDFGISSTTTFVPSYQDADLATGPIDRRISSQTLVDVQIWADIDSEGNGLLNGSTVTLGARNLFDRAPEFANAGVSFGYDFSQSELTQRFVYFRLSKRFR